MYDRVEVLSYAYEHLYLADWKDAISDVFIGRAEVIEEHEDRTIGIVGGHIPFPKVVRFKTGISASKFKFRQAHKFNRDLLFLRDQGKCQYCEKELTREQSTIDHVLPRSRGGGTDWENCVICCHGCNGKKGNRTPSEAGMNLLSMPGRPKPNQVRMVKR